MVTLWEVESTEIIASRLTGPDKGGLGVALWQDMRGSGDQIGVYTKAPPYRPTMVRGGGHRLASRE